MTKTFTDKKQDLNTLCTAVCMHFVRTGEKQKNFNAYKIMPFARNMMSEWR